MKVTALAAAISACLLLTACDGGDSVITRDNQTDNTDNAQQPTIPQLLLSGRFIDAPVQGLNYTTESGTSSTDSEGNFLYRLGETIQFSIGGVNFPTVTPASQITPLYLFNTTHIHDTGVLNVARLLQSLDNDRDPSNGIVIPANAHTLLQNTTITDWQDTTTFEATLGGLVPGGLVSAANAMQHLQDTLNTLSGYPQLHLIGRFAEGQQVDEGMAEIVDYHSASQSILVINAKASTVDILRANTLTNTPLANPLTASNLTRSFQLNVAPNVSIPVGGINSVSVNGNLMAVAVEHQNKQMAGVVAFYTLDSSGNPTFLKEVAAGALPDSVVISPNGQYVVVANEGEPSGDYKTDPEGSITLIMVTNGMPSDTPTQLGFTDFNIGMQRAGELEAGVRISHPNATVAQDLEPEYVTFSEDSTLAFVSLQENNAVAVVDLANKRITRIIPLGAKDHSLANNALDPSDRDNAINFRTLAGLYGLYMPDTLASFTMNGIPYFLTANEGDAREYLFDAANATVCTQMGGLDFDDGECLSWIDEARIRSITMDAQAFPDRNTIRDNEQFGRLKIVTTEGDTDKDGDYDKLYAFGTRSFSIWNGNTGQQVADSGADFERITATLLGNQGFNVSNTDSETDGRSDDKGPEPEALTVGRMGDKVYAFVGLERTGGIVMYDVTNPTMPIFIAYTVNRNFTLSEDDIEANVAQAGDLAPEGMKFVSASHSPTGNPLLIVGNEVSGSTTVYEIR